MKSKKQTLKLLFVDMYEVNTASLNGALGKLPIMVIHQENRKDPFLLDTGIEVKETK